MEDAEWDRLVGDIYAAAADAEGWQLLPARLASLFNASMCTLWSLDSSNGRPEDIIATTLSREGVHDYAEHFYARDPWRAKEDRVGWDVALPGSALIEDRALAATDYYADFGLQHETFHLLGSRHQLSTQSAGIVSKAVFCRPRKMEMFSGADFALMDRLIPHLRRAWQMRHQIIATGEREVRTAWEQGLTSALLSLPGVAIAVDGSGRVRFANAAAEKLGSRRDPSATRTGVEAFLRPRTVLERARLRRSMADAASGEAGDAFLLGVGEPDGCRVTVSPLADSVGKERLALLLVTPLAVDDGAAAVDKAMRLFGLSRAEAEITLAVARGLSPAEVAEARTVRISTVRTLLLRAQGKVGTDSLRGLVAAVTLLREG